MWALDADLASAFDRIDHDRLLAAIRPFPAREMIRGWLKAGVFEPGKGFAPTEEGTPQGGVISPLLLNVALHGLEEAAGVRYAFPGTGSGETKPGSPVVIRYADDLVALCHSGEQAEQIKTRLAEWLAPRGLVFNEDKTQMVHLGEQGFDFLGFNVRRYGSKLLIKPSKAAIGRLRQRLAFEMRVLRGSNSAAVIARLNPIIKGWAAYYRGVVSSKVFHTLDYQMWKLTYKWTTWQHNNKPKRWIVEHYFGKRNKSGTTAGCSAIPEVTPTLSSFPGPTLFGMSWSRARPHPMTPPWPTTGPNGGERSSPRWTITPCACSPGRMRAVRSAGITCSPPNSRRSPRTTGNDGGNRSPVRQ